jgi:hypothetical protein
MSKKFKKGDRVIANQTSEGNSITEGKEYEVLAVEPAFASFDEMLVIVDDRGEESSVFSRRFARVESKPREFALYRTGAVRTVFTSQEEAVEAARSQFGDGIEFFVAEIVPVVEGTVRKIVEVK